jgi:hypothetical protein
LSAMGYFSGKEKKRSAAFKLDLSRYNEGSLEVV